jgi:PDZ domain-containing protein
MNELFKKHGPVIRALILPYLFILFLLVYPINYYVTAPGGLSDVGKSISIDYDAGKAISGSFSSTYVIHVRKPTFFEFIAAYFSPFKDSGQLTPAQLAEDQVQNEQIAYLDHVTSLDASIIVAYEAMAALNPNIRIAYEDQVLVYGKASYLSHYAEIGLGDEFVAVVGDGGQRVTDYTQIGSVTTVGNTYPFTFRTSAGTEYTLEILKQPDSGKFGLTFASFRLVNEEETYPKFTQHKVDIGGPSGGLMQALYIYNVLSPVDITRGLKIAGTGTIAYDGTAGDIGGVKQKIAAAYVYGADLFFVDHHSDTNVYDDYVEALAACEELGIRDTSWIIPVQTFQDCLDYLEGLGD